MPRLRKKIIDVMSAIVILSLIALDGAMWKDILTDAFPHGVIVFTNASSSTNIAYGTSYIDLAIISSPQTVNYEGYQYLLQHDQFGAFLYNGRTDAMHTTEWQEFMTTIAQKHIPLITVGAGDKIRYAGSEIDVLSPNATFVRSPDINETAVTQRVITSPETASSGQSVFLLYNK